MILDGPWIVAMWQDGEFLNKKEVDELWDYIMGWVNPS